MFSKRFDLRAIGSVLTLAAVTGNPGCPGGGDDGGVPADGGGDARGPTSPGDTGAGDAADSQAADASRVDSGVSLDAGGPGADVLPPDSAVADAPVATDGPTAGLSL